jgi:hypothetical protein
LPHRGINWPRSTATPGRSIFLPGAIRRSRMMKRFAVAVLVCCLFLPACSWFEWRDARTRVEAMMESWRTGGTGSGGDMQEAVCMWYQGTRFMLDDIKLAKVRDEFDNWRHQKSLYKRIDTWEISSMAREKDSDPPALILTVDIDGKTYGMRVVDREPIEWVN